MFSCHSEITARVGGAGGSEKLFLSEGGGLSISTASSPWNGWWALTQNSRFQTGISPCFLFYTKVVVCLARVVQTEAVLARSGKEKALHDKVLVGNPANGL